MRIIDADAFERAVMFSDDADLQDIIYRLRDFPTADPMPWIPCTERLPDTSDFVIVTDDGETTFGRRFDGRWWDASGNKQKDVTAWAPMPEPWKGKE